MDKYTVYEVADILQTSHTTIYNKLNNKDVYKELKNFIIKHGKTRYVSKEGIEILRKYINFKESDSKVGSNNGTVHGEPRLESVGNTSKETLQEIDNKLIDELKERIKSLESQLSVKDRHIDSLLRQNENSQVLLKQQQDKILLLEEPKEDQKKGWFRRWL